MYTETFVNAEKALKEKRDKLKNRRIKYLDLKEKKICIKCKKPAFEPHVLCKSCFLKERERKKANKSIYL